MGKKQAKRIPVPLDAETRSAITTPEAAYHLSRKPQTLRIWACKRGGPIEPVKFHGRLAWRVSDIKRALGVA